MLLITKKVYEGITRSRLCLNWRLRCVYGSKMGVRTMRGERSRWRIVASASSTDSDFSPKSITTLASTATSGLGEAAGIVEFQKLVIELFALAVRQIIAARTILGPDHSADGSFFHLRFLAFHRFQFRTISLTRQHPKHSKSGGFVAGQSGRGWAFFWHGAKNN
jgi:hypothetical protein